MDRSTGWLVLFICFGVMLLAWNTYPFLSIGIFLAFIFALAGRFPLFGWFLSGFISGLLGGGRRRRW